MRHFPWDLLLLSSMFVHLALAPYTKVEESFNIQAMHDLLFHTRSLEAFDHLEFPGVVPRTFLGSVIVAALASPLVLLLRALGALGPWRRPALVACRLVLGLLGVAALSRLGRAVASTFGPGAAACFAILSAAQFHLCFYLSRPLPNTFALVGSTLALSYWLQRKRPHRVVSILAVTTAVFRCDLLLLALPVGLEMLVSG